jgi:hypothetical protein
VDSRQAELMLALLRSAAGGAGPAPAGLVDQVLRAPGTDLILRQQNISRRVDPEQYRALLTALPSAEPPELAPADAGERSRRGLEGLRQDVWPALLWGTAHADLLEARIDRLRHADLRSRAAAIAREFLPDGTEPDARLSIVMGGRAGAAAFDGGDIYVDVLALSYKAASGTAGAYPTPEEQVEFFAHEMHHLGLGRTLEKARRGLVLSPEEAHALDALTALVMEGGATYLINAHRDIGAMRRDPAYADFLSKNDALLESCRRVLETVLRASPDAEAYDRATAPLSGNGWHSAGALLLSEIDAAGGLEAVFEVLRDPRRLLFAYDEAVRDRRKTAAWTFDANLAERLRRLGEPSARPRGGP